MEKHVGLFTFYQTKKGGTTCEAMVLPTDFNIRGRKLFTDRYSNIKKNDLPGAQSHLATNVPVNNLIDCLKNAPLIEPIDITATQRDKLIADFNMSEFRFRQDTDAEVKELQKINHELRIKIKQLETQLEKAQEEEVEEIEEDE